MLLLLNPHLPIGDSPLCLEVNLLHQIVDTPRSIYEIASTTGERMKELIQIVADASRLGPQSELTSSY